MLIRIDHATTYSYQQAPRSIIQMLRLTPRPTEGQHIRRWDIETDVDARLRRREDAFGNIVHALYVDAPTERLTLRVSGEVETTDLAGAVRAGPERLSPLVYLRETSLTARDKAISALATAQSRGGKLDRLHDLMRAIHKEMRFEIGATTASHTAAEALKLGRGVCQDYAHLFISAARCMGAPARYVSGHLFRSDGLSSQEAAHAWAEAYVEDLGWIGFDPANGICPTDAYVRVAVGLDYLGAAPVRGSSYGGGTEHLAVQLDVRDARAQPRQQQGQQQA
ncbi:Transglutaminase-like superfamily protein [compost metagenome]